MIDLPQLKQTLKEGLTVLDYLYIPLMVLVKVWPMRRFVQLTLVTSDSSSLVDVSQDVIVREDDCDVVGIDLVRERARFGYISRVKLLELLKDKLIGRVLDKDVVNVETGELVVPSETILDEQCFS